MIEAKIKENVYHIPQSWEDVMYKDAIAYYLLRQNESTEGQLIHALCGIDEDTLMNLSIESINKLADQLAFVNDESVFNNEDVKEEYKYFDFGSLKYKQEQKIKQLIDPQKTLIENAHPVFEYLFNVNLNDEPFVEWIGTVNFFLNKWYFSMISSETYRMSKRTPSKYKQVLTGSTDLGASQLTLS